MCIIIRNIWLVMKMLYYNLNDLLILNIVDSVANLNVYYVCMYVYDLNDWLWFECACIWLCFVNDGLCIPCFGRSGITFECECFCKFDTNRLSFKIKLFTLDLLFWFEFSFTIRLSFGLFGIPGVSNDKDVLYVFVVFVVFVVCLMYLIVIVLYLM